MRVGTALPFEQGPALLASLCGLQVAASTVRRLTEAAGAALCAVTEARWHQLADELPEAPAGAEVQQLSVDGAMVPLVGGTWREVRTLALGSVEVTADGGVRTRELSYFSRMAEAERFADLATVEVHRRGVEHARVVAAVVDGAAWCQSFIDLHAPRAVRILDFPHAVEHLGVVAHAVFGEGSVAAATWLASQRHTLRHGDADVVLRAIAALPVAQCAEPERVRAIRDRELGYFTARRAQLAYPALSARGLPIGSGAVESANKRVVEARLKGPGMHWAPDQVNPMLALRGAYCSQQWEPAWDALSLHQRAGHPTAVPRTVPPAIPVLAPAADPPRQAPAARVRTVVNGRPTRDHPWKQGLARLQQPTVRPPLA